MHGPVPLSLLNCRKEQAECHPRSELQATTESTFFQSNLQAPDLGAFVDPFKKMFDAYRLAFLSDEAKKDKDGTK